MGRPFYEKRMGQEVEADTLGDEFKGYVLRITGGNDKQGFPMKQGVLTNGRVRLLLKKGTTCYRPRKDGERKRKSVHGCIVDGNLSVLSMAIIKKGEAEVPGLTDNTIPRRLGPKRVSKRPLPLKDGKKQKFAAPKVRRLVTPVMLQRKRHRLALKRRRGEKNRLAAAEYAKILAQRQKEAKEAKELKRKRSASLRESKRSVSSQ